MSEFFETQFYNDQLSVVYREYRLFKKREEIAKTKNFIKTKHLHNYAGFDRDKYFPENVKPLSEDVKRMAAYEKKTYEDMQYFIRRNNPNKDEYTNVLLAISKDGQDSKEYNLTDAIGLFTELDKVIPFDQKSIIDFAKKFGLPYGAYTDSTFKFPDNAVNVQISNYMELNLKLMEYRYIFDVFQNVVTYNPDRAIERTIEEVEANIMLAEEGKYSDQDYVRKHTFEHEINDLKRKTKEQVLQNERGQLTRLILNKDVDDPMDLSLKENGQEFMLKNDFKSLFQFAYFQMMQSLVNNTLFKRCENCNHIFEATNDKMRFCPALPLRKRSSCEMAYNNRKKKAQ